MPDGWMSAAAALLGTLISSALIAGSWSRRQRSALTEELELLRRLDPATDAAGDLDAVIRLRIDRYRHRQELGVLGWLMPAVATTAVWLSASWLSEHIPFIVDDPLPLREEGTTTSVLLLLLMAEASLATVIAVYRSSASLKAIRWVNRELRLTPAPRQAPVPSPAGPPDLPRPNHIELVEHPPDHPVDRDARRAQ